MSDKPADAVRAACVDVLGYTPKIVTIHCILAAVREKYPPAQCGYFVRRFKSEVQQGSIDDMAE